MDLITPKLEEVRWAINKLRLFTIALDSLIVFILSSILFLLLGVEMIFATAPSIIYFTAKLILVFRDRRVIPRIVDKDSRLDERLQTAFDNRGKPNLISRRLMSGVSQDMDDLAYSSFVETKSIYVKTLIIILLLFTVLTMNFFHISELGFYFQKDLTGFIRDPLSSSAGGDTGLWNDGEWEKSDKSSRDEEDKTGGKSGGKIPGFGEGPIPGTGGGAGETAGGDIYGAPSSARIEGQDLEMEVHPEYGGEIEIKDVDDEVKAGEFRLPEEIKAANTPEQEPVEYEKLIREYFERLSQGEGG